MSEEYSEGNLIDIEVLVSGTAALIINDEFVAGDPQSKNKVTITLKKEGDVLVNVNGEDFHYEPTNG